MSVWSNNVDYGSSGCIEGGDTRGAGYRGKVNVTKSGWVCQRWDSQSPNVPHPEIATPK